MEFKSYLNKRIEMFDALQRRYEEELQNKPKKEIAIRLPGGEVLGKSWETTPFLLSKAHNSQHSQMVVAKFNGALWDVHRPLEESGELQFLTFDDEEGKKVFWHSSAHVLGEASETCFECHLCLGPPAESGFFYEMDMKKTVVPEDYEVLNKEMKKILKENQRFTRLEVKKADLLEMFSENPLKLELITEKVEEKSTVYRCGPLIDFCLGPHVQSTSVIKAIEVTHHGSSFFLGDSSRPVLQRVYGISFPTKQQMSEYLQQVEEAKRYNHRKIGAELDLFFFSHLSPGSCFFLPKGAFVYNALIQMMKQQYKKRGFKEVITPNMYTNELWKTSGHWEKYKDDMFCLSVDNAEMALKPMNCPGHCVMFKHMACSYKELPLRLADFGVLHRNEVSGALSGLTRVRRFQQDDAHIFAQSSRVSEEILSALGFLREIYAILGFEYSLCLSTRPESYIGEVEIWDSAEEQLKAALDRAGCGWELNEGDGAFYGPKIDISIKDAMGRRHQCGTIQLDFQMPKRFDLKFRNAAGEMEQPVMVHRAILGSVERMSAILFEHFKGKLPPWLNPNQVVVVPVTSGDSEYAERVGEFFGEFEVVVDRSENTLNKKILNAEKQRYSFVMVVGQRDRNNEEVSIRKIGEGDLVIGLSRAKEAIRMCVMNRDKAASDILRYVGKV